MRDFKTLSLGMLCALTLAACQPAANTTSDDDVNDVTMDDASSSSDGPYLDDDSSSSDDSVELNVNGSASVNDAPGAMSDARVIKMTVSDWSFQPSTIAAKKGEKVVLELTGVDGIHSLAIPALNMNVRVEPGKTVTVVLPTDVAGTYEAMCRIPCGAGHKDMKATVVIS
jgi:cytochrome c oxidase subunit II